mmetsp:Transcript_40785/g.100338  ORF Transcript_40785/g.100338 Transcript_40785/m.100338 type:complete len:87 (+) Transcript_40785:86-346(+)|eukprot:CAMPEP_0198309078 /NCGR_PEP_ID=MMETSP1450-20131203/1547_1 /TAXON_ID=753684 ORGANISM="Madagascaria erythrocladiodes, Strain CCMP3234" /NCGR_SAMPLE_ID=MMETSP1450 /ASSEMBLY_ACC=CAM_ASM_001115 /LENGTH=86 /DNA_ID=CAMNT_0044011807 /DNA_START=93 /DNA_END=353 /DNA_ORIENTATION=-
MAQQQGANFNRNFRDPNLLVQAFYHFDRQQQGQIAVDEWKGIMSSAGKKMRPGEVDDFCAEADPNNTGWIDYKWFVNSVLAPGIAK